MMWWPGILRLIATRGDDICGERMLSTIKMRDMQRILDRYFHIEFFDEELATKSLDITACTLGQDPVGKVGLLLVRWCARGASYLRDFREELLGTA